MNSCERPNSTTAVSRAPVVVPERTQVPLTVRENGIREIRLELLPHLPPVGAAEGKLHDDRVARSHDFEAGRPRDVTDAHQELASGISR